MGAATPREFLLDVSRLVWRLWRGGLPTGIDRVCLEYVGHFASRALAVVQFKGRVLVLNAENSDRLFALLLNDGKGVRKKLFMLGATAFATARRRPPTSGMIYLNVGHTGLHEAALPAWIAEHRLKAIYLIHDLIPMTHPQFCRAGEASKHGVRIINALRSAAGIICNSRATLDDLAKFASHRAMPLPPTLAAWISGLRTAVRSGRTRLPERPYFITIGTIEGRKNHILLLEIWQRLVASMGADAPILVIAGQRGWKAEAAVAQLDRLASEDSSVRELSRCADDDLQDLLAGATALLMPSLAEGFGLPVIEALQLGTPVIASDLPVYRELVGEIPTYLDPLDAPAWEAAITSFVGNGPERRRQKRVIQDYTSPGWPSHFKAVEAWLGNLP